MTVTVFWKLNAYKKYKCPYKKIKLDKKGMDLWMDWNYGRKTGLWEFTFVTVRRLLKHSVNRKKKKSNVKCLFLVWIVSFLVNWVQNMLSFYLEALNLEVLEYQNTKQSWHLSRCCRSFLAEIKCSVLSCSSPSYCEGTHSIWQHLAKGLEEP